MSEKEGLNFEKVWAMFQETDRKFQETSRELKEAERRAQEEAREWREYIARMNDNLNQQIGYLGRSLGDVVELVLVPGICGKMNQFGHSFTRLGPNKVINRENKKTLVEVDLWLENGDEAMAVEIKTDLSVKWVNKHLERLNLLRKHENITGLKGKKLYAAVAGISIDEDARDLALEKGMYVIDLIEDEDRLEVIAPEGNIGKW
ncbi:MAG: hypothetical protein FWB90_07290 [Fibromonadales bacterium]|nr:hypothetical protein [Fibromonadales bacterium]